MDWEHLRFFLAVARSGTLAGAGRLLNVRHSTVLRRIALFESELGLKLFDRHPSGYLLTEAGREVLDTAAAVEEQLLAVERRLSGRDQRLTGTVRIATLGVLVPWLAEALAKFRRQHPGITIEVAISPSPVSLSRHEADMAIRISHRPPDSLFGRRVASLLHGVYAAPTLPAARGGDGLFGHDWIAYAASRDELPTARWLNANVPDQRVVLRTNHTGMMVAAAAAGIGLALLPCYLGDAETGLRRLKTVAGLGQDLWILTHADLRRTPRIRLLMDFLAKELSRRRGLIEGSREEAVAAAN